MSDTVTLDDVQRAEESVRAIAHETPVLASRTFGEMAGASVLLKAENLQRTGSFKVRGAANRIAHLSPAQRRRGVVAASAGNHAQGVALAAQRAGIPCTIVMPTGAVLAKVEATRGYGADLVLRGGNFDEALEEAYRLARDQRLTLVHTFDDPHVIAGQGTVGLELARQAPDLEVAVVPVGGGGLISGTALVLKSLLPRVRVVGVQVKNASAAALSFHAGEQVVRPPLATIADGIAIGEPGELPLRLMREYVDDVVTVDEDATAHAMLLLAERAKLLVEGAGAVGLAALLEGKVECRGQRVAVLLSGGNVDPNLLSHVLDHGLVHAGRYCVLRAVIPDRPGQLAALLEAVGSAQANVLQVEHRRRGATLPLGQVQVEVTVETRDARHVAELRQRLQEQSYLLQAEGAPPDSGALLSFVARELQGG